MVRLPYELELARVILLPVVVDRVAKVSDIEVERHCAIKFCFRLGQTATETFANLLQAYEKDVLSRTQISWWFKAFSEGKYQLKINHAVLEGLQLQEMLKMWTEFEIS